MTGEVEFGGGSAGRVCVSVRALVFPDTRRVTCTYTPWHGSTTT
ncbi:hypothetical protein SNL152K_10508 [Streptomyces sp. NL15-2K]|nr:hypothetical protein SNL152K_10508 [Streptomyces sp. NL15-2K]